MTIKSYFGLKPCCDCGRQGNYTVNKNGYQFTVCSDCVHNYSDEEEEEENTDRQKQDEEFGKEFEKEVEREKARVLRNLETRYWR